MTLFLMLAFFALQAWAQVPAEDRRVSTVFDTNTHFQMPSYPSLEAWEARKLELRRQILFAAGLDPMPARSPLTPQIFGRIQGSGYTIEKVLLQTLPGYWLGGNLYRPAGKPGPFPAVASPHGHWSYGRLEHQPLASIPGRCINLARQGYVVLAYDMVGYNDTLQTPHAFGGRSEMLWGFGPLGLQLWNSMRVVDFLESLPEVDAKRIGATGASGGGTQTFLLSAVDDRIRFAAPVNMISAIMQGGSPCENAPGLRVGAFNVEFGAMMAPRPLLMISATGDWTRNTLKEEHPAIKQIYSLYGRPDLVEGVQFDAPHNYNLASREAVYRFFARHVLDDNNAEAYKEQSIRVERLQDMLALHGRTLPEGALNYDQLFTRWREESSRQRLKITDAGEKRRLLAQAIRASLPGRVEESIKGYDIVLSRAGQGDRVPGVWRPGTGRPLLIVHGGGSYAARQSADFTTAVSQRRPVLAIDTYMAKGNHSGTIYLTFQLSDYAHKVQDILTAFAWLESRTGQAPELTGIEAGAVWSRFAAALLPKPVTLNAETSFSGADAEFQRDFYVPGIQQAGGWSAALELTR
jgi:hypothetical protein